MQILFFIVLSIVFSFGVAWFFAGLLERLQKEAFWKAVASFRKEVENKSHYNLWAPNEQRVWASTSYEVFFRKLENTIGPWSRMWELFDYRVDDDNAAIYIWQRYGGNGLSKNQIHHFHTQEQSEASAKSIASAIESHNKQRQ